MKMKIITTRKMSVKKMIPNMIFTEKVQKATQKYFMKII